jgi:transglutaminase-like putative cysteine protease
MYLVEIEAGREALYDSVDALAAAIRRGEVGPQARIFHRTSSSWISITLHPEFRKAAAARRSEPLPPLGRTQWTFFGVEPKGREIDEPPAEHRAAEQVTAKTSESRGRLRGLLGRAFRSLSTTPKASETAGS